MDTGTYALGSMDGPHDAPAAGLSESAGSSWPLLAPPILPVKCTHALTAASLCLLPGYVVCVWGGGMMNILDRWRWDETSLDHGPIQSRIKIRAAATAAARFGPSGLDLTARQVLSLGWRV